MGFRRIFEKLKTSISAASEKPPPPPYAENLARTSDSGTNSTLPEHLNIKAKDIPQWTWTNSQCRAWLAAVFSTYYELTPKEARTKAQKFEGHGATIYVINRLVWEDMFGVQVGSTLRAMAVERMGKGGLPRTNFLRG